ncbi:TylF/MycF/NovP-related O-methyltransferase [Persicitalea sp.]|uniref:TylF/MycF/NovP-related O-methyltransferase n=1 Tax=Persicitalea sp. TaxID=3100273 RepID=UPI0035946176
MTKYWSNLFKKTSRQRPAPASDPWRYADIGKTEQEIIDRVSPFTMTSPERLISLIRAAEYVIEQNIEGDFVECGVWRGGSAMAMALTLERRRARNRQLYLYDTYEGMSEPTPEDESFAGETAKKLLDNSSREDARGVWCYSTLEEVMQNVDSTRYPSSHLHFVKGKVEDTIPDQAPDKIALLRLDTDWYESTKHEMEHLFPRLRPGGVIIIDDYGHWKGCRRAVDEYLRDNGISLFLTRVDYTCRLAVKM